MKKIIMMSAAVLLAAFAHADTIVQWGISGGDTGIVTANQNGTRLPFTFVAGSNLNPAVGANYYPTSAGRCPVYNGASSITFTNGIENVVANNVGGDNLRTRQTVAAGSNASAMVLWESTNFVTSGRTVTNFSIQLGGAHANNTGSLNWLVEKGGAYYISSQSVAFSGTGWTSASVADASTLTWNTFTPFTNGVATIGSATNITLDNVTSLGYYFNVINGDVAAQLTGAAPRFFLAGGSTNPPAGPVYYALTGSAGANGSVSPSSTNVLAGGSATFTITASNNYRIASLTTNGTDVTGMSFSNGSTSASFTWSNVQAAGVLTATFTEQVVAPTDIIVQWGAAGGDTNIVTATTVNNSGKLPGTFTAGAKLNNTVGANYYPANTGKSPVYNGASSLTGKLENVIVNNVGGDNIRNRNNTTAAGSNLSAMVVWEQSSGFVNSGLTVGNFSIEFAGAQSNNTGSLNWLVEKGGAYYISAQSVAFSGVGWTIASVGDASTLTWNTFTPFTNGVATIGAATNITLDNVTSLGYYFNVTNGDGTTNQPAGVGTRFFSAGNAVYHTLTVTSGSGGGSYTNGAQVEIVANAPARKVFVHWTGDTAYLANSNSATTTVTMPAQAVSVTATYTDATYLLTVTSGSGSASYTNGQQMAIVADVISGKTFVEWIGDTQFVASASSASTTVTMPAQAVSLTATYVDIAYALTVTSGTGGGSYTNGHQVAIAADVISGKTFVEWIGDTAYVDNASSASATVTMPLQAVSLTATYVDTTYALTVTSGTGSASYTNGHQVGISATVIGGKTFVAWTGDTAYVDNASSASATVTMPAQAIALTATYTDTAYALTVTSGTGGGSYTNGHVQAIAANAPASGYAFDKWTGDTQFVASASSASTTVTMPAQAVSVTATYIATEQYTTNAIPVPYSWLAEYGITNNQNAAVLLDPDGDGLTTAQEYIAGTVPTNAASVLKAAQANRNVVTWTAQSNRIYSVYWSTNLVKGFALKQDNLTYPTNNATGSYTNAAPDSRLNHYQVKVRMQ